MNICIVTETFPPEVNGVAMTNRRLVDGLGARGHQVTVVRPAQRADRQKNPIGVDPLDSAKEVTVPGIPLIGYPGIQMGLPVYFRLKTLMRAESFDVVHIATEGPLGIAALLAARRLRIPVTSTFHTNFQLYCEDYGAKWLTSTMLSFLRWFHNRCAYTFAPSHDLIESLEKESFERLIYLGRGVDRELFNRKRRDASLRKSWGANSDDTPVAIYVGRAAAEKNIPLAIEAFYKIRQRLTDARMVVVGDGPVRAKLEKTYPDIHFAGMRYGTDLATHYASADLFLFGSTSETFGNVVTEAMTSGLISIVYDYAAGQRFINDGINGFLARFDDPKHFIEKALEASHADDHWAEMRDAAEQATAGIPWSSIISDFEHYLAKATHPGAQPERMDRDGLIKNPVPESK